MSLAGSDRSVPAGSGQATPFSRHPLSEGPSGSSLKVHSTGAAGAASLQIVPQRSRMVCSWNSVRSSALGAGFGVQFSSASCAARLASAGAFWVHQTEGADPPPAATLSKLFWANWHRDLGKLAMDVMGADAEIAAGEPYDLNGLQRMFLFARSDTIYAGSNEIQRNIISERVLGLPRGPR